MTFKTLMLSRLLVASALMAAATPLWARQASGLSLDQAVEKVQHDTGGRVLSADRREFGRKTEYRMKAFFVMPVRRSGQYVTQCSEEDK